MDPCPSRKKYPSILPLVIGIGAIILIVIPLGKTVLNIKKELQNLYYDIGGLKQHVNYIGPKLNKNARLPPESDSAVKNIIREQLNVYDSDKTGKTDFALESAGGRIVKIKDTENYVPAITFLGITLSDSKNGPCTMIQSSSDLGECWAFKGNKGTAIIKLLGRVRINAVSIEHISPKISPTGDIVTAPKEFSVYGLPYVDCPDQEKILLGKFEYLDNGSTIQMFEIIDCNACGTCIPSFDLIELQIHSNHGSSQFTCVYRFRVHGELDQF